MDNVRLILAMALVFLGMLLYQAWLDDYGPKPEPTVTPRSTATQPSDTISPNPTATNQTTAETGDEIPAPQPTQTDVNLNSLPTGASVGSLLQHGQSVKVETDVLSVVIDTVGGDVRYLALKNYPVSLKQPDNPYILFNDSLPNIFIAQSGLLPKENAPTHLSHYETEQTVYQLRDGAEKLAVKLTWSNDAGVTVDKVYQFTRGSHLIEVQHIVHNQSETQWEGRLYTQWQRTKVVEEGHNSMVYTYSGGAISSPEVPYEKISFDNMKDKDLNKEQRPAWQSGWSAMVQHYFLGAWVPPKTEPQQYYVSYLPDGGRYVLGYYGNTMQLASGQSHTFTSSLYAGPKLQETLEKIASHLDLTVDYGWFWVLAKPLFIALEWIHDLIGNWGWAIIILTILIKLAFFHLSATSYKSMANMRRLQPRLTQLKERYGDDRTRMHQAMMDMYKKEKINPLGGCLPIVIQIPVFIALYWVLLESVELRHAPWILWIQDLSAPDPLFILPLIMGGTMLIQQHLNPAPMDPMQAKVMMVLPVVFTVFFAFFPSGLVLYWVVNNTLSILQQWVITRQIEKAAA